MPNPAVHPFPEDRAMTGNPDEPDEWQQARDNDFREHEPWEFLDLSIFALRGGSLSPDAGARLAGILVRFLDLAAAPRFFGVSNRGRKPAAINADDWSAAKVNLLWHNEEFQFTHRCIDLLESGSLDRAAGERLADILERCSEDDAVPLALGGQLATGRPLVADMRLAYAAWDELIRAHGDPKMGEPAVEARSERIQSLEEAACRDMNKPEMGRDRKELYLDRLLFGSSVKMLWKAELEALAEGVRVPERASRPS